jgi:hypothetical protein
MLRNKISSDIHDLNELHKKYWWIPDENMVRPTPEILEEKRAFSNYVLHNWMSYKDFILDTHFKYRVDIEDGHKFVSSTVKKSEWNFQQSLFPYNIPGRVRHYILWNSLYDYFQHFDDSVINNLIKDTLDQMVGIDSYDFAWYKNPKPSIPELFHVQVFWIQL